MLKGKKLTNYFIYAFGEIILVVMGILIALWINNWNKEQQIKQANKNLQVKILVQLERDINSLENFKQNINSLNQVYLKTLN
jgi:sensor domain CHASE-containing protein